MSRGPNPGALRYPSADERDIVAALLSTEFPGRAELLLQSAGMKVRSVDENGSFEIATTGPSAPVTRRIPVEAELEDVDGTPIHILLHVIGGTMREIEVYRNDSGRVHRRIVGRELNLIVL